MYMYNVTVMYTVYSLNNISEINLKLDFPLG